jgi:hypothetical protein
MIYNNLSYKNQMEVEEGMEWINKMVVDGEYLDAIKGLTELMGMFEEDITFHKLVSNLRDTAKDLWKEQLEKTKLISGIKCRKCNVYLQPHTEDEHLDINHMVHKCEGGHKRKN